MIVLITSIKHPENSKSYRKVWELLNNTLSSVCNQIDKNFKIIVVCNKRLSLEKNRDKILKHTDFIKVNFPPVSQEGYEGIRIDRGTKYVIGLKAAKKYKPEYIMFFDADDYIGNNISEYVNKNPKKNGWVIHKGLDLIGDMLRKRDNFFNGCGTANIFKYKLIMSKISMFITTNSTQEKIIKKTDEYFLKFILGSHRFAKKYFEDNKKPLEEFPFRCAIRLFDTGENHSDFVQTTKKRKELLKEKPHEWEKITEEQKLYFGIK
ncbi:glycosyltransferase family 2 protein [Candidatus Woesearchaeota archaeon]|nr:glycosyltransferase family 2 protein [Candidatus Woesearchaeota archaeon]